MSNSSKILIGVLLIAIIGAAAYYFFSGSNQSDASSTQSEVVGQDILVLAEKLQTLSIDQSVFTGAVFESLSDRDAIIQPEAQGRFNPFSNIGSEAVGVIPRLPYKTSANATSTTTP